VLKRTFPHKRQDGKLRENSSHGLLGCDAVSCCGRVSTFRRAMLPPTSLLHVISQTIEAGRIEL
jgi:hypothetical protein